MSLKSKFGALCPRSLALAGMTAMVFVLPDGIPFALAICGTATAGAIDYTTVVAQRSCVSAGVDKVSIGSVTLTPTSGKCEYTAQIGVVISKSGCKVNWKLRCQHSAGTNLCRSHLGATGIFSNTISRTHGCDTDTIHYDAVIDLEADSATCDSCGPNTVVLTTAACTTS